MPKMNLEKFLGENKKDRCTGCRFKLKKEPALVPPPDEIVGIIISQDPTVRWMPFYKYLKNEPQKDIRRKMLFASAISLTLINRILEFRKGIGQNTERRLFDVIFEKTYWTHLHKCFTDKSKEELDYKTKNAKACADNWLDDELGYAIGNKTRFIIALGKDVGKWLEKRENKWEHKVKIIYLPHPSGQNNPIWYRSKNKKYHKKIEQTDKQIKTLLSLVA
jgi:hypothetical protein